MGTHLGVDVNLSLVSDGTSSIRNEARKPRTSQADTTTASI